LVPAPRRQLTSAVHSSGNEGHHRQSAVPRGPQSEHEENEESGNELETGSAHEDSDEEAYSSEEDLAHDEEVSNLLDSLSVFLSC